MLMKKLQETDRFYLILAGVALLLLIVVVISTKGVISAIGNSNITPEEALIEVGVDTQKLDEVYTSIQDKEDKPLDLGI